MRRQVAAVLVVAALLLGAGDVHADFPPPPQPAPPLPSAGLSQSTWAYGYVRICCWPIPPNTIAILTTVDVGPGTWRFDADMSFLIDPHRYQDAPWSLDLWKVGGTASDYYGGTTGVVTDLPSYVSTSIVGIGAFTEPTRIALRFWTTGDASLIPTQQFDSGPTSLLVAQRLSDDTAIP